MSRRRRFDHLVIGGGFYGCCLALFLRSVSDRVVLVEALPELMDRASRVNQARVHTGFHYPRSALTAVKSMVLHRRFARDFPEAVFDDFQMLYAIARRRSKVSAKRFHRMFSALDAPIAPASPAQRAFFDDTMIEDAFACAEVAFDSAALRRSLGERLAASGVEVMLNTSVTALSETSGEAVAELSNGAEIVVGHAFNVTYARINDILGMAGLAQACLKHEMAEIALVRPPEPLARIGITVMDGPFFSAMPYPAAKLHSLTHVRYTPHQAWLDGAAPSEEAESRARHMILDAARYVPEMARAAHIRSLFEIKTVLLKNEQDDGRPILYQRRPANSRVISILGGKIDNVYDLFELVTRTGAEFAEASDHYVLGRRP